MEFPTTELQDNLKNLYIKFVVINLFIQFKGAGFQLLQAIVYSIEDYLFTRESRVQIHTSDFGRSKRDRQSGDISFLKTSSLKGQNFIVRWINIELQWTVTNAGRRLLFKSRNFHPEVSWKLKPNYTDSNQA